MNEREKAIKRILEDADYNPLLLEARKILTLEKLSDRIRDLESTIKKYQRVVSSN